MQETTLEFLPSAFHAPAWSPDGKHLLLGAEKEDGQAALFLTDEQGSQQEALADLFGQSFFGWSPDSQRIAFVSGDAQASDESVQVLTVLDPEQPENKIALQEELFAGFFWSPDSRRLAYFLPSLVAPTPEPGGQEEQVLFLEVKVLDVRRGDTTQVGVFRPTNQFITMLAAFDQYQYSWSLWSPDSRNLVLSATGTSGEDGIYILEAAANLQPRFLANGGLGLWSWR
jgi:Tol biopolymer transport system component